MRLRHRNIVTIIAICSFLDTRTFSRNLETLRQRISRKKEQTRKLNDVNKGNYKFHAELKKKFNSIKENGVT